MISLLPLESVPDLSLNELGDQLRDLLGDETIIVGIYGIEILFKYSSLLIA